MIVKFQKYYVAYGALKARVWYSVDNRIDKRKCVTIYAKDYDRTLGEIFSQEYVNNTDLMTDYFEKGKVVLFEGHAHYQAARNRAEQIELDRAYKAAQKGRLSLCPTTGATVWEPAQS